MTIVAEIRVPASQAAFESTFEALPGFQFDVEQVVDSGKGAITPPVWVGGASREEIEAAFAEDPTVRETELVSTGENRWLYRIDWDANMNILTDIFLVGGGMLLDAFGRDGDWMLRLLYDDTEAVDDTVDNCRERDVEFEIERLVKITEAEEAVDEGFAEPSVDGVADADVTVTVDLDEVENALEFGADPFSENRTETTISALQSRVGSKSEEIG